MPSRCTLADIRRLDILPRMPIVYDQTPAMGSWSPYCEVISVGLACGELGFSAGGEISPLDDEFRDCTSVERLLTVAMLLSDDTRIVLLTADGRNPIVGVRLEEIAGQTCLVVSVDGEM